ncbi:MAG: hypothetical protein RIS60_2300, partial [Pseudomonadota bacterium]
ALTKQGCDRLIGGDKHAKIGRFEELGT